MPDREKVIKGLECCASTSYECRKCPYGDECLNTDFPCGETHLISDALTILKEQEAIEPTSYMDGLVQRFTCGKCGKHLLYAKWGHDNFCSKCGQAVKWDEID